MIFYAHPVGKATSAKPQPQTFLPSCLCTEGKNPSSYPNRHESEPQSYKLLRSQRQLKTLDNNQKKITTASRLPCVALYHRTRHTTDTWAPTVKAKQYCLVYLQCGHTMFGLVLPSLQPQQAQRTPHTSKNSTLPPKAKTTLNWEGSPREETLLKGPSREYPGFKKPLYK